MGTPRFPAGREQQRTVDFRKALDRYFEGPGALSRVAIGEPTSRAVAEHLLRGVAEALGDRRNPPGRLAVQGALSCGEAAQPVRQELNARRAAGEALLRERFERAKAENDLPAEADPADLARHLATISQGMAVQAAGGAGRDELQRVAEMALRAWPEASCKTRR